MASTLIPAVDLVPSVASRIVNIDTTDLTEGYGGTGAVTLWASCDLNVPVDGKIIQGGESRSVTVELAGGKAAVRLPTYDPDAQPAGWVVWVKKSWAPWPYPIRVPVGTGAISLAAIPPVLEARGRDKRYLLNGAVSVAVTEGAAGGTGSITDGVLNLNLSYPRADYRRGALSSANLDGLTAAANSGQWDLSSATTYYSLPFAGDGVLHIMAGANGGTVQQASERGAEYPWIRTQKADGTWWPWRQLGVVRDNLPAADVIAAKLEMRESLTVAVASDSTANDVNDWPRVWLTLEKARRDPDLRIEFARWDAANARFDEQLVQAGSGTPASGGIVLTDTFDRTAAELVGSTTSGGQVWGGAAGGWSADGQVAKVAAVKALSYNAGGRDGTTTATFKVVTTKPSAMQQLRLYSAATAGTLAGGVWVGVTLNTTGGVGISLWKTISGTSTQLAVQGDIGLTIDSATAQTVTVKIESSIQNVTATITTPTTTHVLTGQISESDYSTVAGYRGLWIGSAAAPQITVDSIEMATPLVPAKYRKLRLIGSAVAGATLEYQRTRLAQMYPASEKIDVLMVAGGHNYQNQDPATYLKAVQLFLDDYWALHPESALLISSQNPQIAPAANPEAHAARQRALRLWAKSKGYSYLGAFERFIAQPDGGASLITPGDGVHPTTPPAGTATTGYGSTMWAQAMADLVMSHQEVRA